MHRSLENLLQEAQAHAQSGRFTEMLAGCDEIVEQHGHDLDALLKVGALYLNFGYLARARECGERARELFPGDLRA